MRFAGFRSRWMMAPAFLACMYASPRATSTAICGAWQAPRQVVMCMPAPCCVPPHSAPSAAVIKINQGVVFGVLACRPSQL